MIVGSNDGDNVITLQLTNVVDGDDTWELVDTVLIDQGGPGWPAATGVPFLPSVYIGLTVALGAGVLAYLLHRRFIGRKSAEI